jgi:tRNA(Ile)-lysidine synthetase-like protein
MNGDDHHNLIEQVRAFCTAHGLFERGTVVVAVSGGADSLVLLHVLIALRDELGIAPHVATFDHGLRGAAGAADVTFVREVGAAWGVPVTAGAADVPALARTWKLGIEAAGRRARYAFLAEVAGRTGATRIATGHNRDDQAETVLLHVIRGAGLAGLRGMLPATPWADLGLPPMNAPLTLVRPLLDVPRAAIERYAARLDVVPRQDSTNLDTSLIRNRLRHQVFPLLETINPALGAALARLAAIARDDYSVLRAMVPPPIATDGGVVIARGTFTALHPAQARLMIRLAAGMLRSDNAISYERAEAARQFFAGASAGSLELGAGLRMMVSGTDAFIHDPTCFPTFAAWLPPGAHLSLPGAGEYVLPTSGWRLDVTPAEGPPGAAAPLDVILALPHHAPLTVRTPHSGDRFRPRGMGGHSRKLSDVLNAMRVRPPWRDRIPLMVVGDSVAWFVVPCGDAPRARVAEPFSRVAAGHTCWRFRFTPPAVPEMG